MPASFDLCNDGSKLCYMAPDTIQLLKLSQEADKVTIAEEVDLTKYGLLPGHVCKLLSNNVLAIVSRSNSVQLFSLDSLKILQTISLPKQLENVSATASNDTFGGLITALQPLPNYLIVSTSRAFFCFLKDGSLYNAAPYWKLNLNESGIVFSLVAGSDNIVHVISSGNSLGTANMSNRTYQKQQVELEKTEFPRGFTMLIPYGGKNKHVVGNHYKLQTLSNNAVSSEVRDINLLCAYYFKDTIIQTILLLFECASIWNQRIYPLVCAMACLFICTSRCLLQTSLRNIIMEHKHE